MIYYSYNGLSPIKAAIIQQYTTFNSSSRIFTAFVFLLFLGNFSLSSCSCCSNCFFCTCTFFLVFFMWSSTIVFINIVRSCESKKKKKIRISIICFHIARNLDSALASWALQIKISLMRRLVYFVAMIGCHHREKSVSWRQTNQNSYHVRRSHCFLGSSPVLRAISMFCT